MPRLMLIAHGHPELSHGGAERACYAIHSLVRKGGLPGWDSVHVARATPRHIGHDGAFGAFRGRPDEIIVCPPEVDHFFQASCNLARLYEQLDALVDRFRPDLVHIHHFTYWGIELFEYFAARGIPFLVTLHEYMAICHRYGQMLKTDGQLCQVSSPAECAQCFPELTAGLFFLRDRMFIAQLARATAIIAPSRFLADRVAAWSGGRLAPQVIENPLDREAYDPPPAAQGRPAPAGEAPARLILGYFGQINPFKGIEVLLDAAAILHRRGVAFRLRLFGANLDVQDSAFRQRLQAKLAALGDSVEFLGPYRNQAALRLMADCDAVIIPSVWWENAPLVIQEARLAGVPIIASRIGGIAEKLGDCPHATLFEPGSAIGLADALGMMDRAVDRQPKPPLTLDSWSCLSAGYTDALGSVPMPPPGHRGARSTRDRPGAALQGNPHRPKSPVSPEKADASPLGM